MDGMMDLREQVRVYTGDRRDLWPYVPYGTGAVLDVGCATGEVGAAFAAVATSWSFHVAGARGTTTSTGSPKSASASATE